MRQEIEVYFVRRRNAVVRRAMIMLVACLLLLSTPFPSIGGSDDPASPPMDEVNNGTSPIKIMNDTELVSAVSTDST